MLFTLLSFLYAAGDQEKVQPYFYLFPMGQGNSQLVVFHEKEQKIGVLYDAGSSSSSIHSKFAKIFQTQPEVFLQFNLDPVKKLGYTGSSTSSDEEKSGNTSDTEISTGGKKEAVQAVSSQDMIAVLMRKTLAQLDGLIVFLSHPDEDHINYLTMEKNILPDGLPVIAFLCGDILSKVAMQNKPGQREHAIAGVLRYCVRRPRTDFAMPYYWGLKEYRLFKQAIDVELKRAQPDFQRIKQHFQLDDVAQFEKEPQYVPVFSGDLNHLYGEAARMGDVPARSCLGFEAFSNTYIWLLNHCSQSINNHSVVVSCTIDIPTRDLRMSFVLTGDAEDEVFQRISQGQGMRHPSDVLRGKNPVSSSTKHLIGLVLPHHGSEHNISATMLSLFRPNYFFIPAGNGSKFDHPSYRLYQGLRSWTVNDTNRFLVSDFWDNFFPKILPGQSILPAAFVSFETVGTTPQDEKQIKRRHPLKLKKLPAFCTNIDGLICMTDRGFERTYSPLLQYNGGFYACVYENHVGVLAPFDDTIEQINSDAIAWVDGERPSSTLVYKREPSLQNGTFFVMGNEIIEAVLVQIEQEGSEGQERKRARAEAVMKYFIYKYHHLQNQ